MRSVPSILGLTALVACAGSETEELTARDAGPQTQIRDGGPPRDSGPRFDPTDEVFADDHLIEVDVDMDPDDFDVLRNQARSFEDLLGESLCIDSPPISPYMYFPARVTIDGDTFDDVGIRKKGFFGSVNPFKPSLKLKFDEFVLDREWSGFSRMTFNNAWQGNEVSLIRQCLGYHLFTKAGVTSPRCNYGRITVNGEYLGVFVHIEAIKKKMLRRWYADDEGALYEGAISDFRPVFVDTFERKTNREIVDRSDLQLMVDALSAPDDELLDRLEPILDIDNFLHFWALEVIIGHWDGYSGRNNNNFYIYRDPTTQKFTFIPWGIDAIMGNGPPNALEPVMAYSLLTRRLYENPSTQAQLQTRMEEILATHWDEIELLTEVRETEMLIRPYLREDEVERFDIAIETLRNFVQNRRVQLDNAWAGGPPAWTTPINQPWCLNQLGEVSGSFITTWGTFPTNQPLQIGDGTMTATVSGQNFTSVSGNAAVGLDDNGEAVIQSLAVLPGNAIAGTLIVAPVDRIVPGATLEIELGGEVRAALYYIPAPGEPVELVGQLYQGTVTLEQAGTSDGAPIVGTYRSGVFSGLGG